MSPSPCSHGRAHPEPGESATEAAAPPNACFLPDPVRQRALLNAFHRETKSHEELAAMLMTVNASLEQHYQELRQNQTDAAAAEQETRVLEAIQGLEIQRFDIMSRLHGEQVDEYGLMPYHTT